MERKRFSVLFFIKRSKLLKNGEAPVRVRVTYDRLYVELQLKRSIKVPLWSQEKEKSTGKDRNSVELNHYIDALRVKFYQIYQDLELEGKIISARAIVNRYQGKDETFKTLYNVFKEHNDNCRKLIGTDYADITVKRYDNCLKYLMELVRRDYKVDDMLLREVNGELVRKFDLYLKTEKHCAQNTVIRYMKCQTESTESPENYRRHKDHPYLGKYRCQSEFSRFFKYRIADEASLTLIFIFIPHNLVCVIAFRQW